MGRDRGIRQCAAPQAPRHDEREHRPEQCAGGVHQQVVDVEHAIRARKDAPHPRQLRRLDHERHPEPDEQSGEDASTRQHPQKEAERQEQQHVQRELQHREVGEAVRRAEVVDEREDVEIHAGAAVRLGVGERKKRVRPDGEKVDERRRPERRAAQRDPPATPVADRHERHEQRRADQHAEPDRDARGIHLVTHASILPADWIAHARRGA